MARRPRVLLVGGIYHITCRGNERRVIFKDDADRQRFLDRLAESAETYQVRIYLYCLMSNHVHLLVETPLGNVNRFMGSVLTGYTVYFNRRHRRVGHLMQGRYGAQVVEGNNYLLKLSRYIHLNPVHVRGVEHLPLDERVKYLRSYEWSSYLEYAGRRKPCGWLSTGPVLSQMEWGYGKNPLLAYSRFVEAGLAETDAEFLDMMREGGVAIGSEGFIEEIKRRYWQQALVRLKPEDISFRHIRDRRSVEEVEEAVKNVTGKGWALKDRRKAGRSVRCLYAWSLQHHAGLTQREIARYLNLRTGSAVSVMIRKMHGDANVARWRIKLDSLFKG